MSSLPHLFSLLSPLFFVVVVVVCGGTGVIVVGAGSLLNEPNLCLVHLSKFLSTIPELNKMVKWLIGMTFLIFISNYH